MLTLSSHEATNVITGVLGLILSISSLLLALSRTSSHLSEGAYVMNKRRAIDLLVFFFSAVQFSYYASFLSNYTEADADTAASYTCYQFAQFLLYCAFVIFVLMWGDTLRFEFRAKLKALILAIVSTIVYAFLTCVLVITYNLKGLEKNYQTIIYRICVWLQGIFLGLAAIAIIVFGWRMQKTMKNILTHTPHKKGRKELPPTAPLWRMNLVMLLCCVCCLLRITMMFMFLEATFDSEVELNDVQFLLYTLFSRWIPFFGLAMMMVYVTSRGVHGEDLRQSQALLSQGAASFGGLSGGDGEFGLLISGHELAAAQRGLSRIDGAINQDPDPGSEIEDKLYVN